ERYLEAQRELAVAADLGVLLRIADPSADGAARHEVEDLSRRAVGSAVDLHRGGMLAHVRDLDPRATEVRAELATARHVDDHASALESHVGIEPGDPRPALSVVERSVAPL